MPFPPDHLVVDLDVAAVERALADWRWLIGPSARPLYVTAAGDVILIEDDGRVLLLDTGGGAVEPLAESQEGFERALSDSSHLDDWLSASLAGRLRQRGVTLDPGQCYGYAVLPVFAEGSYGPDNRRVLSALEHLSFTADVHKQIRDLPDGATIRFDVGE